MDLLTSRKSWLLAPVVFALCVGTLLMVWASLEPAASMSFVDSDACSPFELMTVPLFALIVPMAWLACPVGGPLRRQCGWSFVYSLLGVMALVREQDWHKALFAKIWPEIADTFPVTFFKMRFLKAGDVPLMPKLFVIVFFIVFFAAAVIPLLKYFIPLFRGFFRFEPVAWSAATFGAVSTFVIMSDRLPANLRDWGIINLQAPGHEAGLALCKGLEEGAEMIMATLALLALLQSYIVFVCRNKQSEIE